MRRRGQRSCIKRALRSTLILVFLCYCAHPTAAAVTSITYRKIFLDTSDSAFSSCPSKIVHVADVDFHQPMFHCAASCDKDPLCTASTLEGEGGRVCRLYRVIIMPGVPSGTTGVGVYRDVRLLTEPAQNLASHIQALTTTSDLLFHRKYQTDLIGQSGEVGCWPLIVDCPCTWNLPNQRVQVDLGATRKITTIMLFRVVEIHELLSYKFKIHIGDIGDGKDPVAIDDPTSYGGLPSKTYDNVNMEGRYVSLINTDFFNICLCKMMIFGTP